MNDQPVTPSNLDEIGRKFGTDKASNGHDYLRHYEFHFRDIRAGVSRIIEIGGLNGASLRMWEEYFPNAEVVCIDINPEVKKFQEGRVLVEIGNSGDLGFLKTIRQKYSSADIVIDDGSHRWDHQRIAFRSLFPMVVSGGFYVVEDLHTSFEPNFSGNDEVPFIELLKRKIDYLYVRGPNRGNFLAAYSKPTQAIQRAIDSISFVPRACIVKKKLS
jgi:hypothetical protein